MKDNKIDIVYTFYSEEDLVNYLTNSNNLLINKELNIGNSNHSIIISFEFNLFKLLKKLRICITYINKYKLQLDYNIIFHNITFQRGVIFNSCIFNYDIKFIQSIFESNENIVFEEVIANGSLSFIASRFNNVGIYFRKMKCIKKFSVISSQFISNNSLEIEDLCCNKIEFNTVTFDIEVNFIRINFQSIKFDNSTLLRKMELYSDNCNNKIIFLKTDFRDNVKIYGQDKYNKFLSISLSYLYVNIYRKMILENLKIYTLNLKGTNIVGNFSRINCKIKYIKNWHTARILKHEEYKKSNHIKALKYQSEETRLYKEKLYTNKKWYKNLKNIGDIISIELSSLYSCNGQNWIESFVYTILFPILFFTLSYNLSCISIFIFTFIHFIISIRILSNNKSRKKYAFIYISIYILIYIIASYFYFKYYDSSNIKYIKDLFSFLIPTNFSQILYNNNCNISYIYNSNNIIEIVVKGTFYFIGKIAFWYGSVQTVQAFRKFSKGT